MLIAVVVDVIRYIRLNLVMYAPIRHCSAAQAIINLCFGGVQYSSAARVPH